MIRFEVKIDGKSIAVQTEMKLREAKQAVNQMVNDLGMFAYYVWDKTAKARLSGETYEVYKSGLSEPVTKRDTSTITLSGKPAVMIEEGYGSYDLRRTMLPNAQKTDKAGMPYVDVPFRQRTPNKNNPKAMPTNLYDELQKRIKTAEASGKREARGPNMPPENPQHKTSTFSGIKAKSTSKQGYVYKSFRRLSLNSPASSWIVPAYAGIQALDVVRKAVQDAAPKMLKDRLQAVITRGSK